MKLTRKLPIDWADIAKQSGLTAGKLCRSPHFGWGVQNTAGKHGPSFGCVTPPETRAGETLLKIEHGNWCFYSP